MVLANGSASGSYQINRFDSFRFHLAGAFESRQRFEGASEMASNAIIWMNLIPLACIIISLGHLLIDPSLGGAMAIVYGDREAIAVDDRDGVRRRASAPPT